MNYLFKFKIRGHWIWCHAPSMTVAMEIVSKRINEDIEGYGMEMTVKNIDGSPLDETTYKQLLHC